MKVCSRCKISKNFEEFYRSKTSEDGYYGVCIECKHLVSNAWYETHKEKVCAASSARQKANPEKANAAMRVWRHANKEHVHQVKMSYAKRHPEVVAMHELRQRVRKYGWTVEEYQQMLESQGGVCAICGKTQTRIKKSGEVFQLAIDHDHKTGKVRGLLCDICNQLLGKIENNVGGLEKISNYLTEGT